MNSLKNAINPFVCDQPIEVYLKNTTNTSVDLNSIPTSGDIVANPTVYGITQSFKIDKANKVSVYLHADTLKAKMFMSGNSNKLLVYITETLDWNQDCFKLSGIKINNFMELTGIKSRTTISKCIEELCRYALIAPTVKQGYYWINPHRIFRGNRIKSFPNHLAGE